MFEGSTGQTNATAAESFSGVIDRLAFAPITTVVALIEMTRKLYPDRFAFRAKGLDRLAGTDALRLAIEAGTPFRDIVASWQTGLKAYLERRKTYLLY